MACQVRSGTTRCLGWWAPATGGRNGNGSMAVHIRKQEAERGNEKGGLVTKPCSLGDRPGFSRGRSDMHGAMCCGCLCGCKSELRWPDSGKWRRASYTGGPHTTARRAGAQVRTQCQLVNNGHSRMLVTRAPSLMPATVTRLVDRWVAGGLYLAQRESGQVDHRAGCQSPGLCEIASFR